MDIKKATTRKRREELSRVFGLAIRTERASQKMYAKAISFCQDADWKRLLASLQEDEKRHEKELKSLYVDLLKILALEAQAESEAGRKARSKAATKRKARASG